MTTHPAHPFSLGSYVELNLKSPRSWLKPLGHALLVLALQYTDWLVALFLEQTYVLALSSLFCVYLIALRKIKRMELGFLIGLQCLSAWWLEIDAQVLMGFSLAQGVNLGIFWAFLHRYHLVGQEGYSKGQPPDEHQKNTAPLERELLKNVTRICSAWLLATTLAAAVFGLVMGGTISRFFLDMSAYWLSNICTFVGLIMPIMTHVTHTAAEDKPRLRLKECGTMLLAAGVFLLYSNLIMNTTPYPFIYILLPMCLLAVRLPVNTIALIMYGGFAGTLLLGLYPFAKPAFLNLPVNADTVHTVFITGFIPLFFAFMVKAFETRQHYITKLSERMSLANKAVGLGVWEWSISTRNVWWDGAMYDLYGLAQEPISYARWRQCIHPDDVNQLERLLKSMARAKNEFTTSFRIIHPVLGIRHIQAAATIVYGTANRPLRYVGMNWDVTNLKSAELALHQAKQKAEVASHTKSEFVANMSHEIRTPLNATLGAAQLLQTTELSAPQKKYINMIKHSGESLLAIVNDILDFSKIESGHAQMDMSIFNLRESAQKIATILSPQASAKGLEFILHIDKNVPTCVEGDALKLHQVLVNLTSNAIRFTPGGEVTIEITAGKPKQGKVQVGFAVIDTGIGIAKNNQLNLFDAFTQVDSSSTRQYGGTGLGLAIAKRLVNLMGGELYLESDEGLGSRFYFSLELPHIVSRNYTHPLEHHPLRVLLVDYNTRVIEAVKHLVAHWPWDIIAATSVQQALNVFPTANKLKPFDLLIIDSRVLSEDALFIQQLGKLGLAPNCLRLVSDINHAAAALPAHCLDLIDAYLIKPITHAALLDAIQDGRTLRQGAYKPLQQEMNLTNRLLSGINILLVEDNPLNQVVAKGLLEQLGAHIDQAWNGKEALELISQSNGQYHLIMLDIQMPVMDGYSTCHALNERGNKIPIIAMTAGVLSSEREHCERMGMQGFVPKPIEMQTLLSEIQRLLPKRETPTTPEPAPLESLPIEHTLFYPERLLHHITQAEHISSLLQGIQQLVDNSHTQQESLLQAIEAEDFAAARKILHSQKGAWGNLGATPLYRQICSLETLAQENRLTLNCRQWLAYLQLYAQTHKEAEHWLRQQQNHNTGKVQLQGTAVALEELINRLDEHSLRACDLYSQLKPYFTEHLNAPEVHHLDTAMHNLQFKQAAQIVRDHTHRQPA
ncbi:MAG: ATP-binding protein [Marinagarivorans sp.]